MNNTTGNIARIQGDGGTYDSSHHASGSIRCVKDGSTTPVNMCPVAGCAEGQYYCHAESVCKPANQSCGTLTCNVNGVCDEYESCNCSDCNGQTDHCMSQSGTQLVCAKDIAQACYTDKFPYCLSACLDGYKFDLSTGKCLLSSSPDIPYSKTLTLSGTSGNNNHLFEKIATLPPGEYTFSGSGTSYNDGGGGTNMVFFSEKDINLSNPDNIGLPPDGFDRTKY